MDVSVVICTYNRALSLKGALASLADMQVPDEVSWEVVVVDNNSSDETRSVVEQFAQRTPNLRYVFESNQGLSLARNRGIKESIGHIISFIDDDVIVARDWLLEVKRAFDGSAVACVGGKVPLRKDLDLPDWWRKEYNPCLGHFDKGEEAIILDSRSQAKVGIGANLSFRRSCFEKYGNFRHDLGRVGGSVLMGEDIDFCDRLRRHGELSMYTPRAIVYQCPDVSRITKRYVLRWFFRIGEWILLEDVSYERWQTVTLLFGLPRWRYRDALEHLLKTCWRYSTGRHQDGFFSLVQLTMATGYLFGVFKHGKASVPKAVSK